MSEFSTLLLHSLRAELAARDRELAGLRVKVGMLEALSRCACGDSFTQHDPGTCVNCLAGITAGASIDRKDAERYRWLRDESVWHCVHSPVASLADGAGIKVTFEYPGDGRANPVVTLCNEHLDAAIDAAIERSKP